jgi:hypothetical protein
LSECVSSAGFLGAGLALAGGAALGAGLLFLLDPDKGRQRRRGIMRGVSSLGSTVGSSLSHLGSSIADTASSWGGAAADYAGSAAHSLRDAGSHAGEYTRGAGSYFSDKYNRARAMWDPNLIVENKWSHRMELTVCALGSMVLGATLMYLLDPIAGRTRRNQLTGYARSAGESVSQYARSAGETVSDYARKATDAVKTGANYVTEGVKSATGMGGQRQTGADIGTGTLPSQSPGTLSDLAGVNCPPESLTAPTPYGNTAL